MKIYIYSGVLILVLGIAITDYMMKPKVIHSLDCVLSSVSNEDLNITTKFERKVAIKNGYQYKLEVYDDGQLLVNGKGKHLQDKKFDTHYRLLVQDKVDSNIEFVFNKEYTDVVFIIKNLKIEYGYSCKKSY